MIRRTFYLMAAQVFGRATGFLLLIIMGNVLGASSMGAYGTMTTMLMLATIISTFGIDLWLARHVANEQISSKDFWRINLMKWALTVFALALYFMAFQVGWLSDELSPHRWSVLLVLGSLFFDHIALTAQSILEGRRELPAIAKCIVMRWSVFAAAGICTLIIDPSLFMFCASFFLASAARAIYSIALVKSQLSQHSQPKVLRELLLEAAPMALLNTMVGLYFHIDMLMIPALDSMDGAGFYKVAYTMVEALLFISGAVAASLFPVFSKKEIAFGEKWEHFSRGSYLLLLCAFPISLCTPFVSSWIIELFFIDAARALEFLPSASALNILVWALPAMFINSSLVRLFLGMHWQKSALIGVSITACVNIILNLALIPRIGFVGAAYSTVASEVTLASFLCMKLMLDRRPIGIWTPILKPLLASLITYPLALWASSMGQLWIIPVTILGYAVFLWLTKLVTVDDFRRFGVIENGSGQ